MNLISHLPSLWCHRLSSHCPNLVHTDRGRLWISPTMESHGSDKEKDSVVGWHHTHFVKREPGRILPRVGEGLVLRRCLYPTKWAPTHWFPSVSHSHGANLKPMPRPTMASLSLPGQRAHSWTKRCSHRSFFCLQSLHWKPSWMWPKLNSESSWGFGGGIFHFSLQFIGKLILMHSNYIMKCNVEIFHEGYLNRVWKPDER